MSYAIKVAGLHKRFSMHNKETSLKNRLVNLSRGKVVKKQYHDVLNDISFNVKNGEFFAIVGRNGSGKSTLLKILAGVYAHSKGEVTINGRLVPFIELGVGFNPELTGRDNIYLNGSLLGFSRKEMDTMYESIVEFAELEDFMDERLKNYSSGMQVRLAFSIAIRADSDILLIDEVLAVGDLTFQKKCFDYFNKLKKSGKTMVLVSHDSEVIRRYCERAAYICEGKVVSIGKVDKVLEAYESDVSEKVFSVSTKKEESETKKSESNNKTEKSKEIKPTKQAEILKYRVIDKKNMKPDQKIKIEMICAANEEIEDPIFGITIRKKEEQRPLYADNTYLSGIKTGTIKAGKKTTVVFEFDNLLGNGKYVADLAIAEKSGVIPYDRKVAVCEFVVSGWRNPWVEVHVPGRIKVNNAG